MRTPRVHSHLVAFGKRSLSIGCFSGRPFVQRSSYLGKVASDIVASDKGNRTLGLLLRRPNIDLVNVRPFRIDPSKLQ